MTFGTDINVLLWLNCNNFLWLSGQSIHLSHTFVYDQISAKLMTFASQLFFLFSACMYNKNWIWCRHSGLLAFLPSGHSQYCSKKKTPWGPKSIFSIDRHYKRDVCKTNDRTPRTAKKVNYDSFYYKFLIHEGFIFVKLSSNLKEKLA